MLFYPARITPYLLLTVTPPSSSSSRWHYSLSRRGGQRLLRDLYVSRRTMRLWWFLSPGCTARDPRRVEDLQGALYVR
jgi:hypothetical protein